MSDLPKTSSGIGGQDSSSGDGLKGGTRIGGGKSPSSSIELADPASFSPAAMQHESNATWNRASLAVTGGLAESWFGPEIVSKSVRQRIQEVGLPKEYLELSATLLDEKLPNGFIPEFESLGTLQKLSESPLAQMVIEYMNSQGVTSYEHGLIQASKSVFVNQNDYDESQGNKSLRPGASGSTTWMGPWGTTFGSRFMQSFQVFKNEVGKETVVWFTNAIFGTRPLALDSDGSLAAEDTFRREVLIPILAKRVLYLAETPFPSSIFAMGRNLAFKGVEQKLWPVPVLAVRDFELTVRSTDSKDGTARTDFSIFPQVINLGWAFSADNIEEIGAIVPTVVDGLTTAVSIIEDGFRNHSNAEEAFSWFDFFGAWNDKLNGPARAATTRWIPGTSIGDLAALSAEINLRGQNEAGEQDLRWVAENGAGESVSSSINALVENHLLERGELSEAKEYLKVAIQSEQLNESTKALTTIARTYLAEGDWARAKSALLEALDRLDKFSEGEASLLLGDLYALMGDEQKAVIFYQRSSSSGHTSFASLADSRISGVTTPEFPTLTGKEQSLAADVEETHLNKAKVLVLGWIEVDNEVDLGPNSFFGTLDVFLDEREYSRPVYLSFTENTILFDAPFCHIEEAQNLTEELGPWGLGRVGEALTYRNVVTYDLLFANPEAFHFLMLMICSMAGEREFEILGVRKFLKRSE